jgi:succinate dehydrogenase (ubiquinone) flavoprotein subunit
MMRAFARAIQRRQFGPRSLFLRRQRGFATVNAQEVKGLTVIDHHYEYILPLANIQPIPRSNI